MANLLQGLGDVFSGVASELRKGARLRLSTEWSPPREFSLESDPDSPPNPLLSWLKYKVEVVMADGSVPISYAPYGEPSPPESWLYVYAFVGLMGAGAFGLVWWLRRQ